MSNSSDDEAANQLQHDLQRSAVESFDFRLKRPILKHLNADSSWLLSLPYPDQVDAPPGRCRYNFVIDPWLQGPQVDMFSWFSAQEHAFPSSVQTMEDLNSILEQAESAALEITTPKSERKHYFIDAVCCSHEFTDHCHEKTLKELPRAVPVFAPRKAASLVRSWNYFDTVQEIPMYSSGIASDLTQALLPSWLRFSRIHTKFDAPIYFHSALLITLFLENSDRPEIIVYTPHGIEAECLISTVQASGEVECLALIHGLHDVSLAGARLNLGMHNALKIQKALNMRYWIATHDEVKIARGAVALLLRRIKHTLQVAPGSHPITSSDGEGCEMPNGPVKSFVGVQNGQNIALI